MKNIGFKKDINSPLQSPLAGRLDNNFWQKIYYAFIEGYLGIDEPNVFLPGEIFHDDHNSVIASGFFKGGPIKLTPHILV
jgi:hypothetical protein